MMLSSWRGTGDWLTSILDTWTEPDYRGWTNLLHHLEIAGQSPYLAGPGHWTDLDAIFLSGHDGEHYPKALLTCAAILGSQIMLASGFNPAECPPYCRAWYPDSMRYLTNANMIAIDQDAGGFQGYPIQSNNNNYIWLKPLGTRSGKTKALAFINRATNDAPQTMTIGWTNIGLPSGWAYVLDAWANTGNYLQDGIATTLTNMSTALYIVTATNAPSGLAASSLGPND
jgi:alpha-galactosidase